MQMKRPRRSLIRKLLFLVVLGAIGVGVYRFGGVKTSAGTPVDELLQSRFGKRIARPIIEGDGSSWVKLRAE
jgi:hypothetical protein